MSIFCNIVFLTVLREIDQPITVYFLFITDPTLHSFVYAFPGIAFFFHNHFNTIHHLHFIHLRTVLSVVSRR